MDSERYQWRGEDDPSRVDTAYVRFRDTGLRAHGSSVTKRYTLSWTLDVGDGWEIGRASCRERVSCCV